VAQASGHERGGISSRRLTRAGKPRHALDAFNAALALAPGRSALRGKAEAERRL
jgi:hypothetical protein